MSRFRHYQKLLLGGKYFVLDHVTSTDGLKSARRYFRMVVREIIPARYMERVRMTKGRIPHSNAWWLKAEYRP